MVLRRFFLILAAAGAAPAQPDTRAAEIEQARAQAAGQLVPEQAGKAERLLRWVEDSKALQKLTGGYRGFRPKLGNMAADSGLAFGPEYFRDDLLAGRMHLRFAAQTSTRGYRKFDAEWTLPSLLHNRAGLQIYTVYNNAASLNYYGAGPASSKNARSSYRYEETAADATAWFKPTSHWRTGASAGHLWVNVGPGADSRLASSEVIFGPEEAPGISRQANFMRYAAFLEYDWRDSAASPGKGGAYLVQYSVFRDRKLGRHDFQQVEIDLEQRIPLFARTRSLALRARSVLTDAGRGQSVPFYLQPSLGGADDLRGFRQLRFRDDNSLVLGGEYRWQAFSGLDMAAFADAGKVFPKPGSLNFSNLEGSAGFGFRFNARNRTFLRLDVGFSHEGFQVWVKFGDAFGKRKYGSSSALQRL